MHTHTHTHYAVVECTVKDCESNDSRDRKHRSAARWNCRDGGGTGDVSPAMSPCRS